MYTIINVMLFSSLGLNVCPTLSKLNKATQHWHSPIIVYIILHLNLCTNVVFCLGHAVTHCFMFLL